MRFVSAANMGPIFPLRVGTGVYLAGHWQVGESIRCLRTKWDDDEFAAFPVHVSHGIDVK